MKSFTLSIISAVLFVAGVSAQLTVNTPVAVISCSPLQITWSGGVAPYTLSIHDGAAPNGPAFDTFSNLTGGSYTWASVNFAPNTNLDISLRDNSGLFSQSAPFTVGLGSTSCLNGTTPATTSVAATAAPSAAATTGTTPAASSSLSKAASGSSASGSSSSKASTPTSSGNAAMSTSISYGLAGVVGAVIAAVFA